MALKDSWKKTGTEFGHAFKDLGKAFASTAKTTIRKMDDWANGDENRPQPTVVEEGSTEKPEKPEPIIVEE